MKMNEQLQVTPAEQQQIIDFNSEADAFFTGWFNGSIDKGEIDILADKLDDGLKILYSDAPERLMTKQDLLDLLPKMYGRNKEHPVSRENEYRHWMKLGRNTVLVQLQEKTLSNGEVIRTRSLSVVICLGDEPKLLYSHE